jgi:NTP pyrophosphatase (non-canonical NTP hydrolase)
MVITFREYQTEARKTAMYPRCGQNLEYPALGLAGEVGELCNVIKKISRDNAGVVSEDIRKRLASELGDVLWYVAALATELGLALDHVAVQNLGKLADRQARGAIQGSGENR